MGKFNVESLHSLGASDHTIIIVMQELFERKRVGKDVKNLYVQAQIDILIGFREIRI